VRTIRVFSEPGEEAHGRVAQVARVASFRNR
jgi:hypothetical protein